MPELPEVETVRRGLIPYTLGKTIKRITLNRPDLRAPIPADLPKRAQNQVVEAMDRHGKTMIWSLGNGVKLAWHLGMSGSFRAYHSGKPDTRTHDHVVIDMASGETLVFNDPRRFGALVYAPSAFKGLDPFHDDYREDALKCLIGGRETPIKSALLDQTLVTGIGNIYACEALFESRIHPARLANTLKDKELKTLQNAVKAVLERAIASGGSSLRDHVMVNGEAGKFQHAFAVYGRKGQPCAACGAPVERLVQSGRSSFFCPRCQPFKG